MGDEMTPIDGAVYIFGGLLLVWLLFLLWGLAIVIKSVRHK